MQLCPKAKPVIIARDGDSHGVGCLQGRGTSGSDPEAHSKGDGHSGEIQDCWRSSHAGVLPPPHQRRLLRVSSLHPRAVVDTGMLTFLVKKICLLQQWSVTSAVPRSNLHALSVRGDLLLTLLSMMT